MSSSKEKTIYLYPLSENKQVQSVRELQHSKGLFKQRLGTKRREGYITKNLNDSVVI